MSKQEDLTELVSSLSGVLTDLNIQFPKALEAAWEDAFNTGVGVSRLHIAKNGKIECESIPYEEYFEVSETKKTITESKEGGK